MGCSSKAGRVLFEMEGIPEAEARKALKLASNKLPIQTKYWLEQKFNILKWNGKMKSKID